MAAADFGYTVVDVSQALARLSAVCASRQLVFDAGSAAALSPEDLQAQWQAAAANGGAPDQTALAHLAVVLNHIEAVILSCGVPDAFDVYEACFEVLTKIGFVLQSQEGKEVLLRLLENVHEVYDVLLSCVETYEWVQPQSTGMLRLWMLQVIFVCFGSTIITGRDLMALTDNDAAGAVSLISFILKCEQAPFEMQAAAGRCLVELTTADSVFLVADAAAGDEWQSHTIAKLTAMLNRHVNELIKGIIQFDIVESFGRCICQHQMSHTRTDVVVKHFLTTIHNSLMYCSENQKKLRQHLATQSTIVQDIMIPYVHNILPALYDNPACGPGLLEWQNLKATLQTFVVVTYNINVFRPQLRDADMILRILDVPNVLNNLTMLELLIKTCVNIDFTKGPHYENILASLQGAFSRLPIEQQQRLQRRLTSEQSMRLPYAKSAVQAVKALEFAMLRPASDEATPEAVEARKARRKHNWRNAKNKAKKRKRLFALQQARKDGEGEGAEDDDEEEDSDDEDMPPLIAADGWEGSLGPADEAGVPQRATCQLTGTIMRDPMQTPDGYVFERVALEDWTLQYPSNPLTGAPLNMAECKEATELQGFIQGYQMQMLSASMVAPEAFDEPAQPEAPAAMAAPAPAAVATGPSLLGDLPALQQEKAQKKEKNKIRIESRSVIDCPEDMRCAVDGKVMTNPVKSPYGHRFEKKTLERWIKNCGSVCPITGAVLRLEECEPDAEMRKRVVKFLKGQ